MPNYLAAAPQTTPMTFFTLALFCACFAAFARLSAKTAQRNSTNQALSEARQKIQGTGARILALGSWTLAGLAAFCLIAGIAMAATT